MADEFLVRIWSPGGVAPDGSTLLRDAPVVLDRDLLGVHDASVSRAANAPRLSALDASRIRLELPVNCARSVLALEGLRFEALQHDIAPAGQAWKVAPGQLSRPARVAQSPNLTVALVRQLDWDRPGATHHLLTLPPLKVIAPGQSADLATPALLVIGEAAMDVTPADTLVPAATPIEAGRTFSFRLRDVEEALERPAVLDAYPKVKPRGTLHFASFETDAALDARHLEPALGRLLERTLHGYFFFPVIEDNRVPRLALAYRRDDGTAGLIVGGTQPDAFVRQLASWLGSEVRARQVEARVASPRRVSSAPASHPVLARFGSIETRSPAFARVLGQLTRLGTSELSLLFLGESGTGKEHLAHAVHRASARGSRPFVAVNCSALADELIESELFGHKRGAFTGAESDRAGAFLAADGGTLLLDEIGDAPLRVQLALLRTLETKKVRPVGADKDRVVDVRVLAATSRHLDELGERGAFRQDLYYRLAELTLELPPLRDRREDIPSLSRALLRSLAATTTLARDAEQLLLGLDWPGNVRELRNLLKRVIALNREVRVLHATHFSELEMSAAHGAAAVPAASTYAAPSLSFPAHVTRRADLLWKTGALQEARMGSRYEQRASLRAALLCLATRAPLTTWQKALTEAWHRLFGERWFAAEGGRGLRELVRELGLNPRDEASQEVVKAAVQRSSEIFGD